MASLFSLKINNLRKRSRVLLNSLEENAKIVRKKVKNFRKENDPSSISYLKNRRYTIHGRSSDIWKLRNDSSGVGAALCPDYFRFSPKYESLSEPDMNANRRMILKTEKKYPKSSPQRRGIKECYCYTNSPDTTRKINQRSARTRRKPSAHSSSEIHVRHFGEGEKVPAQIDRFQHSSSQRDEENDESNYSESAYSPPLSGATLIRAQKIDYTPRSKFLRKVQSKVNSLRSSSSPGSQIRLTPKSPSPSRRKFVSHNTAESRIDLGKYFERKNEYPKKHNCLCDESGVDDASHRIPKKTLLPKKTIVSKKPANDQHKSTHNRKPTLRSPPPNKRVVRVIGKDDFMLGEKPSDINYRHSMPKDYEENCPCSFHGGEKFAEDNSGDESLDLGINNVKKFREKNYFDTHASNPSLLGSRSSGSVRQFCLNERLFPEPMGRIHREDIVVSIPPCATRQKKTIHYFPRSLIKQEKKSTPNMNYTKKRRCPSCPLIGHAVDLGALKVSHPPNSLALRYQKGIP